MTVIAPVWAATESVLEEIIVDESLLSVPITVTPVTPEIPTKELAKGTAHDVNSSEIYGIRVVFLFTPSDEWRIQPSFQWQRLLEDDATDTDISEKNRGLQYCRSILRSRWS